MPTTSLAEHVLIPGFAGRVRSASSALATTDDEMQAVVALKAEAEAMGVDAAAFVVFVRDDASHESFRSLLACDPVWCAEYEANGWYTTDRWLEYALKHTDPVRGADIPLSSDQHRAVTEVAERHGFRSAPIVPAPSSGKVTRLGVLCLGSACPGFFDDDGDQPLKMLARSLAMELHEWWIGRFRRELLTHARLTEEDLLLLAHERNGLCTKLIASALNMSETVGPGRASRTGHPPGRHRPATTHGWR